MVGRWVLIAPERAARPTDFAAPVIAARGAAACPFCPGHEAETPPEILRLGGEDGGSWRLRVVPNRYPALGGPGGGRAHGRAPHRWMDGAGAHEVVIETPDHEGRLHTLTRGALVELLGVYRDRLRVLAGRKDVAHVLVFRNHGAGAGATLEHPHSQVMATPLVPPLVAEELAGAARYRRRRRACVFCDLLAEARADGRRMVTERDGMVVLAPFAPRLPWETWVMPIRHHPDFETAGHEELEGLAAVLAELSRGLDRALHDPPFNLVLHTVPRRADSGAHFHWHVELTPRIGQLAGFELGGGGWVNPVAPEESAARLRASWSERDAR